MNGFTRDDILDNISVKGASLPVAVSVFPDELYQAPRSWAEQAFPKLIHFNKLPKGAHFAAFEQSQLPFRRASCRLQITALKCGEVRCGLRQSWLAFRKTAGELRG